jgi:predicted metalloprotease with PDZ domain
LWRGVALLRGTVARWEKTEAADQARALLEEVQADPARRRRVAEQESAERRRDLTARAKALERSGQGRVALGAWEELAKAEGGKAEAKRLRAALAARPYLGLGLEGEGAGVSAVVAGGPAARAGLRPGDRLLKVGAERVESLADLRRALGAHKPGDRLTLEVQRDGKVLPLTVEVGSALDETPPPEPRPSR